MNFELKLEKQEQLKRDKLESLFNWRLISIVSLIIFLIASALFPDFNLALPALLIFLPLFFTLVKLSHRVNAHITNLIHLRQFYKRQRFRAQGLPLPPDSVPPLWKTSLEVLSTNDRQTAQDLDLLGSHSLYSLVSEAQTHSGQKKLLQWMFSSPKSLSEITQIQSDIVYFSKKINTIRRIILDIKKNQNIFKEDILIKEALSKPLVPGKIQWKWKILLISFFLSVSEILYRIIVNKLEEGFFFPLVFAIVSLIFLRTIKHSFSRGQSLLTLSRGFSKIFEKIEDLSKTTVGQKHFPIIYKSKISQQLKKIESDLDGLSIVANPLVLILLNAICPWSFYFAIKMEKKRKNLAPNWLAALEEFYTFEAFIGLIVLYKYQTQTFPTFIKEPVFKVKNLEHPLLKKKNRVSNDFDSSHLTIITGSNMSGKSTFLRTIGINFLLSQMGAPIFAKSLITFSGQLTTCIRITDSLKDGASYFYTEVLRLKHLFENTKNNKCLYLIDEIFRGTNNFERLKGSQDLLVALSKTESLGLISTHDLDLTKLSKQFPSIKNYHFRDFIENDSLKFQYKINKGISPSTNALYIMKKNGLPINLD